MAVLLVCAAKERLFQILSEALVNFHLASRQMSRAAGVVADGGSGGDVQVRSRQYEVSEQVVRDAREMYDDHVRSHGC